MITAGDEFGRTQHGNNNAYAQDNPLSWIDWEGRDRALEDHFAVLAHARAAHDEWFAQFPASGEWQRLDGQPMTVGDWENPATPGLRYVSTDPAQPYAFTIDRAARSVTRRAQEPVAPRDHSGFRHAQRLQAAQRRDRGALSHAGFGLQGLHQ